MIFITLLILGVAMGWLPWYILFLELMLWIPDFVITVVIVGGIVHLFD